MTEAERIGLLKIDFLGLRNLSIIHQIVNQVRKDKNITINIEDIPLMIQRSLNYYREETQQVYSNLSQMVYVMF